MTEKQSEILKRLSVEYGEEKSALVYSNAYELLIATILAAQCTDKRVNIVTAELFKAYPDAESLAGAEIADIEQYIKTCGLYKNKAKNLKMCAVKLVDDFNGEVPHTVAELTSLAGVGRKTANVVRAFAFGIPAMPVDTHVGRVARRIGFTDSDNPLTAEKDICGIIPESDWSAAHHWLIWHGRRVCSARSPECESCIISDLCRYREKK